MQDIKIRLSVTGEEQSGTFPDNYVPRIGEHICSKGDIYEVIDVIWEFIQMLGIFGVEECYKPVLIINFKN